MANQDFNVLGNQRGKVGNIVGFVRKGKQCYRGYVAHVRQSKSEKAMIRRAIFGVMGKAALAFRGMVSTGFARLIKGSTMSATNVFMKKNHECFTASEPDDVTVDYGALVVSDGYLPVVSFGTASFAVENEVTVPFDSNSDSVGASGEDLVYIFAYQPDINMGAMSQPVSRSAGTITLTVPKVWSGMQVHVWGFAANGDEDRWVEQWRANLPAFEASPSTYIGSGTIA